MTPSVLRALAILIALVAVIDPAVTSTRATRPEVAVVTGDSSAHRALAARVARELGEEFTVIPAPFAAAAATVVVGSRLPTELGELASPVFAVLPVRDGPAALIEAVHAPASAALEARVTLTTATRAIGANGRTLEATLRMGDVVIDRATRSIGSNDERHDIPLSFVPTSVGAVPLRVTVTIDGSPATTGSGAQSSAAADVVLDVRDVRWSILFFDPRPSWLSTFVRRSVERDPRFVVTSRVVTSRGISTDVGRPPGRLDDVAAISLFDALVVGAPDALTERDVAGLDAYLRRRGGAVVLLLDDRANGPYDRLTRVREWRGATGSAGFLIRPVIGDSGALRASSIAWPASLPAGANAIARGRSASGVAEDASGVGSEARPVIWRSAVGAGELLVSGALDAWRYRDPEQSQFDRVWRALVADAVAGAPPPLDVGLTAAVVAPGERTEVYATLRDAALADPSTQSLRAPLIAVIDTPDGPVSVRLWPEATRGRYRGSFRAPSAAGTYRLAVTDNGFRAEAPLFVSDTVARATPDESDLVAAWSRARDGQAVTTEDLPDLASALRRTLRPPARNETWYPMRSPWWIVPFTLLLGTEWLWRRRRGLA
jgi:hypothetical protein